MNELFSLIINGSPTYLELDDTGNLPFTKLKVKEYFDLILHVK